MKTMKDWYRYFKREEARGGGGGGVPGSALSSHVYVFTT